MILFIALIDSLPLGSGRTFWRLSETPGLLRRGCLALPLARQLRTSLSRLLHSLWDQDRHPVHRNAREAAAQGRATARVLSPAVVLPVEPGDPGEGQPPWPPTPRARGRVGEGGQGTGRLWRVPEVCNLCRHLKNRKRNSSSEGAAYPA